MMIFLIQGATLGFAAAAQPGPFQTYLISRALDDGWRRALPVSLAPLISDGPIIVLVLVVLGQVPVWFQHLLQIVGGLFLLYLAFGALKSWREYETKVVTPGSVRMGVLKAAMVNILNPNPWLGWSLVMGPLLLKGWSEAPSHGLALLLGFYMTIILGAMIIVVIFSGAKNLGPRLGRPLIGISGIGLALLGIFQVWQGATARW